MKPLNSYNLPYTTYYVRKNYLIDNTDITFEELGLNTIDDVYNFLNNHDEKYDVFTYTGDTSVEPDPSYEFDNRVIQTIKGRRAFPNSWAENYYIGVYGGSNSTLGSVINEMMEENVGTSKQMIRYATITSSTTYTPFGYPRTYYPGEEEHRDIAGKQYFLILQLVDCRDNPIIFEYDH